MKKIYYLNSTHWDREWYVPFQSFRYNLVDMINSLLEILDKNPDYKLFCLDGQTIVLEDYAEIEPIRAEKLRSYIEQGRIKVGPWYVMPDEFLLSGESLIRNLMIGDSLSKKWGSEPWKYGYVNDIFGHIAQMPQIFSGFGINGAYIGRGLGNTDFNHFLWKSPDGTECYTSIGAYGAFARDNMSKYGTEGFSSILKDWIDLAFSRSNAPIAFFSNTDDHKYPTEFTPEVIKMISKLYPDAEVADADLSEMANELKQYKNALPQVNGELIKPLSCDTVKGANLKVLYHTLSSYYPLKQQNDICQNMLEKRIEPMLAVSDIEGNTINHRFVDVAYKYLVQNHPHDSICGCSCDQVHKDMVYRFDQTSEICDRLYEKFLQFENDVYITNDGDSEYKLKIYNFQTCESKRIYKVNIYFYKGFKSTRFGYARMERINNFVVFDSNGEEVPYQILSIKRNVKKRVVSAFQSIAEYDVYTVAFDAEIPPCGYSVFSIRPKNERIIYPLKMVSGDCFAENKFVRLEILSNGEFKITDKRNGKEYNGLNRFYDNGEVGDGWRHQDPINDEVFSGYSGNATISVIHSGFAVTSFRIEKEMIIPKYLDSTTLSRSSERERLKITYTVTLYSDSPAVEVEMQIDNNVKDHRMRLLFPTNTSGKTYFAGQAFYFAERNKGVDISTSSWEEPECVEKNMNGIIGKRDDDGNGLAFVSPYGLHEAGCLDDLDNTIAVTLFRCFDRVFLQTQSNLAQLQQKMNFKYGILPLDRNTSYSDIVRLQQRLSDSDIAFSKRVKDNTSVLPSKSYLEFSNKDIVLSIFKCSQDGKGYIVRAYNVSGNSASTNLRIGFDFNNLYESNMNEEIIKKVEIDKEKDLGLVFRPWEIKTFRIE